MYYLVGISLLFATLYAVNLAASLLTTFVWRYLSDAAVDWNASTRSNLIFLFRVLPLTIAIIVTFGFIVPAFVLYEPATPEETIGLKMAAIVCISAFGLAAAVYRIVASWWQTRQLIGDWMLTSKPVEIEGVSMPAYKLRHPFPVIAVVGIFRPRIFVAEQVFSELDKPELIAALSHEAGHISAFDNLKRVAMRVCRDLLVFPLGKSLDNGWLLAAESAADEYAAVRGGSGYALDLASALVKIGRITPLEQTQRLPIAAYLIEPDDTSLAQRVEGLLSFAG
ncbi:MAG: M56 family metallopeptidase [Chloracidobacterium sp.]|nr:M56 family metallopeptidase [Chloracidobacterium sp.]